VNPKNFMQWLLYRQDSTVEIKLQYRQTDGRLL